MSTAAPRPRLEAWRFQSPLGPALRRGAWTAVPVALALLLEFEYDAPLAGAISTGAMLTGFVAFEAPARTRFGWQALVAPLIAAAGALGVLTGEPAALAVLTMTVVAIAGGYCVAVSMRLAIAAMNIVLALLITQGLHLDTGEAVRVMLLGLLGGWIQALFALAAWLGGDDAAEPFNVPDGAAAARRALAGNLSRDSHSFRHAVRWGVALGVGVATYNLIGFDDHGYWIPLTILFVLKPELGDTVGRVAMRAVGTGAGLLVATGLAPLLTGDPVLAAVALGTAAALALALLRIEYAMFTFAVTVFIVLMADLMGEASLQAAGQRGAATAIGIAIAMLAILIWPSEPRRGREVDLSART